jgi:hypothetical protein
MKSWLGIVGRACVEFIIILILLSFAAGASISVALPAGDFRPLYVYAGEAALDLTPLAALLTLFLAFFSFELRIKNRAAGWLGLFCLGALLFSFGLGLRRAPLIRDLATPARGAKSAVRFIPPAAAVQQGRSAVWIGSYEGGEAVDAVGVDFGSDYPRLAYSPRAPLSAKGGEVEIQGRNYSAAMPEAGRVSLVPEASVFAGSWIWDRLAAMDDEPVHLACAVAGGFLLLAIGFRFLCRISGWPLANVFLAGAGLAGLAVMDAALSGPAPLSLLKTLARSFGLSVSGSILLASVEGALGLILGLIDIAARSGGRPGRNA